MTVHDTDALAPAADGRRAEIFEHARAALIRRRRRRAAARAAGVVAGAGLLVGAGVWLLSAAPAPAPLGPSTPTIAHDATPASQDRVPADSTEAGALRTARIRTDPGILARLAASSEAGPRVRRIGDDELLAALEGTGDRYGIMRTAGRIAVVCQTCRADDGTPKGWGTGDDDAPAAHRPRNRG